MKEILDLLKEIDNLNGECCEPSYLQMENTDYGICISIISDDEKIFEWASKSMESILETTKDALHEIVRSKKCKKQLLSLMEEYGDLYVSAVMDEIGERNNEYTK